MECTITFCDLCNIDQDVENFQPLPGQKDVEEPIGHIRGVVRGTFAQAAYQYGWEETDTGHICQCCLEDEAVRLSMEETTETISGFVVLPQYETSAIDVVQPSPEPKRRGRPKKVKNVSV